DPAAAQALAAAAMSRWGRIDILVNNAGVAMYRLLLDTTVEEWDAVMAVHLRGAFNCTKAVLPHMIRAGRGRIINLSSVWGQLGAANEVAYSTAKAGLIGFTRALAREVGRAGITVNAVAPGAIETDMLAGLSPEERAELAEAIPLNRLGTPEEVASVVVFLASPQAAYFGPGHQPQRRDGHVGPGRKAGVGAWRKPSWTRSTGSSCCANAGSWTWWIPPSSSACAASANWELPLPPTTAPTTRALATA